MGDVYEMTSVCDKDNYLSREDTKAIKGIAVILMLIFHLWHFPDRIPGGVLKCFLEYNGEPFIVSAGSFGRFCVPLFFFMGGYGTYLQFNGKSFDIIKKIKGIFFSYWKVFLIFIPIAFVAFGNQPIYCMDETICNAYSSFSFIECVENFFAIRFSYNREWWFLWDYLCITATFPFVRKCIESKNKVHNLFFVTILSIVVTTIIPYINQLSGMELSNGNFVIKCLYEMSDFSVNYWFGMVFAKDNLLQLVSDELNRNKRWIIPQSIFILASIFFIRTYCIGKSLDLIFVPLFIVAIMQLLKNARRVFAVLSELGRESTNMWLMHSFFCYYFYSVARLVVVPHWAVPSLLILIIITYVCSKLLDYLWEFISRELERITNIFEKKNIA